MFGMPSAAAPIRSPWRARRLRSRTVNCSTGSMPCWARMAAHAIADICALAPAPSVTLTASARPFRQEVRSITLSAEAASGGEVSAVITKARRCSRASSRPGDLWVMLRPTRSRTAAIGDELLQALVVKVLLQLLGRRRGFRLQIIATGDRLGPAPFGEIGIGIAQARPHGSPVDRLLESLRELAFGRLAAAPDDHLRGNVTPIDDDQLRHGAPPFSRLR